MIGAPGCARSPKENGFDWVLMRLLAGLPVSPRGHHRHGRRRPADGNRHAAAAARRAATPEKGRRIAAVVLAAGRSTRMGAINKLIAEIGGKPLVRIAAEQALASRARPVIVVTGHERERVEAALAGLPVRFVHNPDYADGLGTSLKAGIAAVPADADGAIVCLGDMPQVDAALIDKLIAAFDPERGALVVVPSIDGQRGNPVVWSRRFFHDLMAIARRHRRPPPDRQLCRGGRRSAGRRRGGADRRRHARVAFRRQGGNRTRLRLRIVDRAPRLSPYLATCLGKGRAMTNSFTPVMRALVAATLLLATATLMLVAVNTARAAGALAIGACGAFGEAFDFRTVERSAQERAGEVPRRHLPGGGRHQARLRRLRGRFHQCLRRAWLGQGAAARPRARTRRLRSCYKDGGKECVIRTFFCDAKG